MSTLKSVGNKLFKTELANHKVELGLAQDLEKLISDIKSLGNPINQNIDRLTNLDKMIRDEKELSKNNLSK
jgi:chaperonin cofactor prefoldin